MVGLSGPSLIEPVEVLTKKLTTEPLVKPLPVIKKLAPARIGLCTVAMCGWSGSGVGVGVGVGPGVGVRVVIGVGIEVAVGVALGDGVGVSVSVVLE